MPAGHKPSRRREDLKRKQAKPVGSVELSPRPGWRPMHCIARGKADRSLPRMGRAGRAVPLALLISAAERGGSRVRNEQNKSEQNNALPAVVGLARFLDPRPTKKRSRGASGGRISIPRLQVVTSGVNPCTMWLYVAALLGFFFLFRWYREKQVLRNLTEKYVFITGCDSGFGNLLARQLDSRGLRVLAACFTQEGAEKLKEATSERLQTTLLDVRNTESVAKATEWVKNCVGEKGLWGLVNNAGISVPSAPNEWLTKEDFKKIIDINLLGLIDVTIHMLPLLRRAKGRIVNVASIMGRIANFGGGYCPSKYGVEAFSDSLRLEMATFGVKVCIIEPGFFRTAITNDKLVCDSFTNAWVRLPEEVKKIYGESFFQKMLQGTIELQSRCNPNLSLVTNCMEHALTAVYPRTRYSAGSDAKYFFIPMAYMPTWLYDLVFGASYRIKEKNA